MLTSMHLKTDARAAVLITGLLALLLGSGLGGCAAEQRTMMIDTLADGGVQFPTPSQTSVRLVIPAPSDQPAVATAESLSLRERHLLSQIERGFQQAGFRIARSGEADFVIWCGEDIITGEVDTYRRVPVYETRSGTFDSRGGFRHYHSTTTSDVIVPERRAFAHRVIRLAAIPGAQWRTTSPPGPGSSAVIWMGSIRGDQQDLDGDIAANIAALLAEWGQTRQTRRSYTPTAR